LSKQVFLSSHLNFLKVIDPTLPVFYPALGQCYSILSCDTVLCEQCNCKYLNLVYASYAWIHD